MNFVRVGNTIINLELVASMSIENNQVSIRMVGSVGPIVVHKDEIKEQYEELIKWTKNIPELLRGTTTKTTV